MYDVCSVPLVAKMDCTVNVYRISVATNSEVDKQLDEL